MSRFIMSALVVAALSGAVSVAPTPANAFCCAAVTTITLSPAVPRVAPRVAGRVEVNECLGMSFLHIVVRANAPDGTQVMASIPPTTPRGQPQLSDWITITGGRGEFVWQGPTTPGVPNGGLTGRTIMIVDSSFTMLAQGTFVAPATP